MQSLNLASNNTLVQIQPQLTPISGLLLTSGRASNLQPMQPSVLPRGTGSDLRQKIVAKVLWNMYRKMNSSTPRVTIPQNKIINPRN